MADEERIDVSFQVKGLCRKFGLEPEMVASIALSPTVAVVEVFEENESGHKYVATDGQPAMYEREFAITT